MRPPPWIFTAILGLAFFGPPLLDAKFFYDPANTQIDGCVRVIERVGTRSGVFALRNCSSTMINVRWSEGNALVVAPWLWSLEDVTVTINGECTVVIGNWKKGDYTWNTINGKQCLGGLVVRDGKATAKCSESDSLPFCQGKSLQQDVGDGLHLWTSIEYKGKIHDGPTDFLIEVEGNEGDFGEYLLPTTTSTTSTSVSLRSFVHPLIGVFPTSTSSSTTTTTTLASSTSMLAVTTPIPHVFVTGAFECWGQSDSWGTVVVLNRRTDASGRRVLEFCGSQEMLPNGTLCMEAGGAPKPEEVFYFMRVQHVCESLDTTDSFACFSGNLGQSEWAAKAIDLGSMELGEAGKECHGKLARTLVPTKSVDKCTAEEPMLTELFGDLVDQVL
ncbi:hypothetical protein M3Y99_01569200 [Aphelenchoides fujianensis]|nr:hypothetical protein M3Y99_01569200 [Aphelenchoides fujianensis]